MKAAICFSPSCRRTWAPGGERSILYSLDRHHRLSAIRGITVSQVQHHLGLHLQIHDQNINFERVIEFITLLHLRGKFILVLDRYSAHREAVRLLEEEYPDHSKYSDLSNFIPEGMDNLHQAVTTSVGKVCTQTSLLRSLFQYAGLGL